MKRHTILGADGRKRIFDETGRQVGEAGTYDTRRKDSNGEPITITMEDYDESKFSPYDVSELYERPFETEIQIALREMAKFIINKIKR